MRMNIQRRYNWYYFLISVFRKKYLNLDTFSKNQSISLLEIEDFVLFITTKF